MDIVKLKATIAEYDQQEKRMPVYVLHTATACRALSAAVR